MLSGETANGEYSVEAVKMMAGTCVEAESLIDYDSTYTAIRAKVSWSRSQNLMADF
jgi:pyruvate kinase